MLKIQQNYQNFNLCLTEFPRKSFRVNFLADWINRGLMLVLILNIIKINTEKDEIGYKK